MKSNLFPIWKAPRTSWVLPQKKKKINCQKRGKQNKNSKKSDLMQSHSLPLKNLFHIICFLLFWPA